MNLFWQVKLEWKNYYSISYEKILSITSKYWHKKVLMLLLLLKANYSLNFVVAMLLQLFDNHTDKTRWYIPQRFTTIVQFLDWHYQIDTFSSELRSLTGWFAVKQKRFDENVALWTTPIWHQYKKWCTIFAFSYRRQYKAGKFDL